MTTEFDKGRNGNRAQMLRCELGNSPVYPSLVLALRDMREANGRDPVTGVGDGNMSWIGLSLGMIVLDTLSGDSRKHVETRWKRLLTAHQICEADAQIIYRFRCSLLHGYGPPRPADVGDRMVLITPAVGAFAVDTSRNDRVLISVPVFCGRLVERIAYEAPRQWDTSLINTNLPFDD